MKYRILVSDKFDPEGISKLKADPGLEVIYEGGHNREKLLATIGDVEGLIIRSATKVDSEVIEKAKNLKVVIRAGVGVDNIDIPEASRRGIIVMNSPAGNSVSTAEHAIAMLFAAARGIPQAHLSMKGGKWEKSKFKGVEITGKTLGVVGLGRIGKEVVKRAKALKMRVIGYDPFIPAENLSSLEIEIVPKEVILAESDFITVHTPLTDTTANFVSKENLSQLKKGVKLINCARGGIYNEEALAEGLKSGQIATVALDVFSDEPVPSDFPLLGLENCIMTPHLGASTDDAEFAVAMDTVDQIVDFFKTGLARNALNFPTIDPDSLEFLKPYFVGGEKVGKLLSHFSDEDFNTVEIHSYGEIASYNTSPVVAGILRGALTRSLGNESVNYVNAPVLAKDRGIRVTEVKSAENRGFRSSVEVKFQGSKTKVKIKYTAINNEPLVVGMLGQPIEFKPEGILLFIENRDVPRVVGTVGMFLGDEGINIAHLELSRNEKGGTARCVITIDDLMSPESLDRMRKLENILSVELIDLR